MSIILRATLKPSKAELLQSKYGDSLEILGAYRFDDPAGEVGIEGLIVRVDEVLQHLVVTYRGEPLVDTPTALIGTMEHSLLGTRWVYDGRHDPVALAAFHRALTGQQRQAAEQIWENGKHVEDRKPTARVTLVSGAAPATDEALVIVDCLDSQPTATDAAHLRAEWDGGTAIVATLG